MAVRSTSQRRSLNTYVSVASRPYDGPMPAETITVVKDEQGVLHVPMWDEEGPEGYGPGDTVCGVEGKRIEHPVDHAGMWCTTCSTDAIKEYTDRMIHAS